MVEYTGDNGGKYYFRVIRYSYPRSVKKKSRLASSCTSHAKALPSLARIMQQTTSHNCVIFLYTSTRWYRAFTF